MAQVNTLMDHMINGDHITPLEAMGVYRIFNCKGRIADLRTMGVPVETKMKVDATGKKYASYFIPKHLIPTVRSTFRHMLRGI